MGVATTSQVLKDKAGREISPTKNTLGHMRNDLEKMLDPDIWGSDEWSEEFKTRVRKDIRKIDNFIDHLQKMRTRY